MSEKKFWGSEITFGAPKCKFLYVEMFLKALSVFFEVETEGRDFKKVTKSLKKYRDVQKAAF